MHLRVAVDQLGRLVQGTEEDGDLIEIEADVLWELGEPLGHSS